MRKAFIILCIITLSLQSKAINNADSDSLKIYQRADLSYVFGCQIDNDNFQTNPGFSFQGSFGMMINEFVGFGIGAGHQVFQHEKFIPLFVEAVGYKKDKHNTPYVKMQAGYSIGWHTGKVDMEGYRYRGGLHFDAGIGRKFRISDYYSILFHCSYRHQFANIKYTISGSRDYTRALNYDMIVFSLGLLFSSDN